MLRLDYADIQETETVEIMVGGERCITISLNPKNMSIQIPKGGDALSISNTSGSFFLRTPDRKTI